MSSLLLVLLMSSCLGKGEDEPDTFYPNGIVTVKAKQVEINGATKQVVYLQLDEQTTLYPSSQQAELLKEWKGEFRALINFVEVPEPTQGFTKTVKLNWLRAFAITKSTVPAGDQPEKFGKTPILLDPQRCFVEDGYLNLRVRILVGELRKKHVLNLLTGVNPQNPFELELRHDAKGDIPRWAVDYWVAFRLDKLPAATDAKQMLIVKYRGNRGEERIIKIPLRLAKSQPQK